jgi:hypothetical protein
MYFTRCSPDLAESQRCSISRCMSLMVEGWGAGPNMWRTFRQEVGGAGGAATRPPSWNADPCHPTAEKDEIKKVNSKRFWMFTVHLG